MTTGQLRARFLPQWPRWLFWLGWGFFGATCLAGERLPPDAVLIGPALMLAAVVMRAMKRGSPMR